MSEILIPTDDFHCVSNAFIYDMDESLIAGGYPMRTTAPDGEVTSNDISRAIKLSKAANGINHAHDQFLSGIRLSFDLTFSNKAWVEAERYRFLTFVSSQSTMHRITKFDFKNQCNQYVSPKIIAILEDMVREYHELEGERDKAVIEYKRLPTSANEIKVNELNSALAEKYLKILYNNPAGFELTARMTTNYRCLKNIYHQRKDHRLPEWREFCRWIETLPYAHELIICDT